MQYNLELKNLVPILSQNGKLHGKKILIILKTKKNIMMNRTAIVSRIKMV